MSRREIEFRPIEGCPPVGARPELAWTPIDRILIDDSYQRPLGEKNWRVIAKIARAFDWGKFTPVLLAPLPEGRFALINGQHRTHAAAAAGRGVVPSMIVPMDTAQQAEAFAWINGQVTAITIFHLFKAALAAGTPWAIEADRAVAAAGCRLMRYNNSAHKRKAREIYSITNIRAEVEAGRADVVTRAIAALAGGPAGAQAERYTARVLKPWLTVVALRADLREAQLRAFCAETDFSRIIRTVSRRREKDHRQSHNAMMAMLLGAMLVKAFGKAPA